MMYNDFKLIWLIARVLNSIFERSSFSQSGGIAYSQELLLKQCGSPGRIQTKFKVMFWNLQNHESLSLSVPKHEVYFHGNIRRLNKDLFWFSQLRIAPKTFLSI